MKKNILIILLLAFSIKGFSQRTPPCITGNSTMTVGQTVSFTTSNIAQCDSCYDWDINGDVNSSDNDTVGTVKIINSDKGNTVQIQGILVGAFSLQLTYFDETGCHTCSISGNVAQGNTPLPTENCFGFDPVYPTDLTSQGLLNYGYIGFPYNSPISSVGLSFTWKFKFLDGTLLTFYTQNPTFRELCPQNPVKSFALLVSNGVQSKYYRNIDPSYPIPGFGGANTPTCFLHPDCEMGSGGLFKKNLNEIIVSPNPTNSIINFSGENLNNCNISIYTSAGVEIIKKSKLDKSINLEKFEKGMYIYIITDEKDFRQEGKVILK